jgi:hypothetical protein
VSIFKRSSHQGGVHSPDGALMAYRDGELAPGEKQIVQTHLSACEVCRDRLKNIEAQSGQVSTILSAVAPNALEAPAARRALFDLKQTTYERKDYTMLDQIKTSKRMQRTVAGIAAVIVIIGLFTLAPVRALASDFLALFRVQKFVAVDIDPERMQQIAEAVDQSMGLGEVQHLTEEGQGTEVGSLDEAAGLAGFTPRTLEGYGDPSHIVVHDGSTSTFTPDVQAMRQVFQAVNVDPNLLPDNIDGQTFTLTTSPGVAQVWTNEDGSPRFMVMQAPSPTIEGPDDVDYEQLGEAMLQLLGMDADEAHRLSQSIDWTTTVVLPIPRDVASVREVNIDGTTGLVFDARGHGDGDGEGRPGGAVLWEKNGIVYLVAADQMNSLDMQEVADHLK